MLWFVIAEIVGWVKPLSIPAKIVGLANFLVISSHWVDEKPGEPNKKGGYNPLNPTYKADRL